MKKIFFYSFKSLICEDYDKMELIDSNFSLFDFE